MDPKDFVHLHVHSHYSLLEALASPKKLVARAKKQGRIRRVAAAIAFSFATVP